MTTNLSTRASAYPRMSKALGLALVSILAVVLLVGSGSLYASSSAPTKFDNVQVFIQTSQDLPYSYTVTAYNTSGFQVAYYHSNFAAAALELPDGTYLFTVQAIYDSGYYPCTNCAPGPIIPGNSTWVKNSSGVTTGPGPIFRLQSSNEYGYAIEQVTGPSSITIKTYNASTLPTTQVTVHVAYVNGTAAQGAWVYASVVDYYYYYDYNYYNGYYNGSNIVSSAQTAADGTAVLTMPAAPLLVTSYLTVPVTPPQSQSNITVTIGGQKVNVTLYWEPTSVTLEGQTLILPPQTSGSITLRYQPQRYFYPMYNGGQNQPGVYTTTTQTATAGVTATGRNAVQSMIPPFDPANVQAATPLSLSAAPTTKAAAKGFGGESLLLLGGAATMAVVLAGTFVIVTNRGKRKSDIVSA